MVRKYGPRGNFLNRFWYPDLGTKNGPISGYPEWTLEGRGPRSGYQKRPHIWVPIWFFFECPTWISKYEVEVFLRWLQWLHTVVFAGERPIVINIDETPITKTMPPRRGFRVVRGRQITPEFFAHIPQRDTRAHATLLACITHDPAVQPHLPQFVCPKDSKLIAAERARLEVLPRPLCWFKNTAGWIKSEHLMAVLTTLRRCVREHAPERPVVVVLDCAPCHTSARVVAHAARLGVHLVFVPTNLTWLLQPLDSHVFAGLKRRLCEQQTRERCERPNGVMPPGRWVDVAATVVTEMIVERDWAPAMADNGLLASWASLRARICDMVLSGFPLQLAPPSAAEMDVLLGRHRVNVRDRVLRPAFRHRPLMPPPVPPPADPPVPRAVRLPGRGGVVAGEAGPPAELPAAARHLPARLYAEPVRRTRSGAQY